jgi:hypothetical protein
MKYMLTLRSRPIQAETIEEKHAAFFRNVSSLAGCWGFHTGVPSLPAMGEQLISVVNLSKLLGRGLKGRMTYVFRSAPQDKAMYDDVLYLEFDPRKIDYSYLVNHVFPTYITAFAGYRGELGDIAFVDQDFEHEREIDSRHGIYRIYPVSFYDHLLSQRAFGLNPTEVAARFNDVVERVGVLGNGVLIIASSEILSFAEADQLTKNLRHRLMGA